MEEILELVKENNKMLKTLIDRKLVEEYSEEDLQEVHDETKPDGDLSEWDKRFIANMKEKGEKYDVVGYSDLQEPHVKRLKEHLQGINLKHWNEIEQVRGK